MPFNDVFLLWSSGEQLGYHNCYKAECVVRCLCTNCTTVWFWDMVYHSSVSLPITDILLLEIFQQKVSSENSKQQIDLPHTWDLFSRELTVPALRRGSSRIRSVGLGTFLGWRTPDCRSSYIMVRNDNKINQWIASKIMLKDDLNILYINFDDWEILEGESCNMENVG